MQSDPVDDGRFLGLVPVDLGHGLLELDGRAQGIDGAGKLYQGTIARQLDQAATVPGKRRLQTFGPVSSQT